MGLRVKQEYSNKLDTQPAAVDGHELPADSRHAHRINVLREEERDFAEELLDTDTACADVIRE